jgi:hypothetical protein
VGPCVAAGIGYTWGQGELDYHNGSHRFSIKGVSVVDAGATDFSASGGVYHLKTLRTSLGTTSRQAPVSQLLEAVLPSY